MEKEVKLVPIYSCEICKSRVLGTRLKKHHEKVHPTVTRDIYHLLTDPATEIPETNNVLVPMKKPHEIDGVWGIEKPKDESTVHVQCDVCRNKMQAGDLEAHMKRKHAEPIDQVDAIGIMVNDVALNSIHKDTSLYGLTKSSNPFASKFVTDLTNKAKPSTQPTTDFIDFGQRVKSTTTTQTTTTTFYTIRITEAHMQEFLNQNRIYPKDGTFYLK